MDQKKRVAILVAGMHRSGTSAVTRILSLAGCDLPKNLMTGDVANKFNERGFWEPRSIADLNDEVLASAGSAWDDWRAFDSGWYVSPIAEEFRERARAVLNEEFGTSRLFVLKDPRICRLLKFWIEAIEGVGATPFIVSPIRNPLDVADSLKARDGLDPPIGHLLWLRHVLDAERASRHLRRAYVRYDMLLSEAHTVVDALGDMLGVSWPRRLSIGAQVEIDEFLSSDLRHHRTDDAKLLANPRLSHWIPLSFEIFDRWSRAEMSAADTAKLDHIRTSFDEASPAFSRALAVTQREITRLGQTVTERDGEITRLGQTVTERDGEITRLGQTVTERDGEITRLGQTVTERDHQIEALLNSRSWRVTAPLRFLRRLWHSASRSRLSRKLVEYMFSILYRHPSLVPITRRVVKIFPLRIITKLQRNYDNWKMLLSPSTASFDKRNRSGVSRLREISGLGTSVDWDLLRPYAMNGQLTKGWYGGRELRPEETLLARTRPPVEIVDLGEHAYSIGTHSIATRYLPDENGDDEELGALRYMPVGEFRAYLGERRPPNTVAEMTDCNGFSIITPFHRHLRFFEKAAASVDRLAHGEAAVGSTLEWVIVNDDSTVSGEDIIQRIPARLHAAVRQIRPAGPGGIVDALNSGIRQSRYRWILFLDCDDEIEPNAIAVLNHYRQRFPRCRYLSSSMTDIDEHDDVLRFRGNEHPIDRLFDVGMLAGHLKAIRRDLFDEIGYLDPRFEPCQDYEFALRTALQEPLLKIPESLYRYRWHKETQSVSRAQRQNVIHRRIQREYMRRFLERQEGTGAVATRREERVTLHPASPRGAAVVRTQNKRRDLFLEAVASVHAQAPDLTPIVVVHGDESDFRSVKADLPDDEETVLLHADNRQDSGKRLGYPANVALDYLTNHLDRFDYLTFLDDDDVVYPCFARHMGEAFMRTGADLVYALSNRRPVNQPAQSGPLPLPGTCLVAENFIPCNSYILSSTFLRQTDLKFDEYLLYLDDWDFLLSVWNADARFHFLAETVSEFRITNDGNTIEKKYPELHHAAVVRIQEKAWNIAVAAEGGLTRFRRDMLDFPWSEVQTREFNRRVADAACGIWMKAAQHRNESDEMSDVPQ